MKPISNTTPISSTPERKLTATREVLLPGGSDHALRELLHDLFTIGTRLEEIRRHLGSCMGLSGPQFSLLMAIQELQGQEGVSVGRLARYLHVAGTFVTAESAKLARKDYIERRTAARDRRVTLLCVRPAGAKAIERLIPEVQAVNDTFFAMESGQSFDGLCRAADRMVEGTERVLSLIQQDQDRVRIVGA